MTNRKTTTSNLSHLKDDIIKNNTIDNEVYLELDVKRGLRNKDGSGVLAGLSRISSVIGSQKIDYQRISVDGELKYRGINIFDLMKDSKSEERYYFEQIAFLLLVGRKPTDDEFKAFKEEMASQRVVPEPILEGVIKGIPSRNIMNKLQTAISALYGFDDNADDLDPYANFQKAIGVIAKCPIIIAYAYLSAYKSNPTFVTPPEGYSQAEAFLYCLNEGKKASELENHLLDLAMVLHAEHGGGNNSTFTTYVVTSSGTDIYCAMAAAVASLKGPLHGAANKKVMDMMADIKANINDWGSTDEVSQYLTKILNKDAHDRSGKIYGLGHAVYTKSDPRGIILKEKAVSLAKEKDREKELELYLNIEACGPKLFQDFKGSKKDISPNVDFFSGFVYDCLGIPQEIYTPIFAMARCAGWCAHRIEEILSGKRIIRPGYKFIS